MTDDKHAPDFLLLPVRDDFMQEPVALSIGKTYEKSSIES